jgi:predicted RNA-binding protein with RPS1 domain
VLYLSLAAIDQEDIVVNKIGTLSDGIFTLTNYGAFVSFDNGGKWDLIYSAVLPNEIYDIMENSDSFV